MLLKSIMDFVDGNTDFQNVELSIKKEDFHKYIDSFEPEINELPPKETCMKSFKKLTELYVNNVGLCTVDFNIKLLEKAVKCIIRLGSLSSKYTIDKNNELSYFRDFCFLDSIKNILNVTATNSLLSVVYFYKYLNKEVELDDYAFENDLPLIEDVDSAIVESKKYLARISIYKEYFEKTNDENSLNICKENESILNSLYSSILFVADTWDDTLTRIAFFKNNRK